MDVIHWLMSELNFIMLDLDSASPDDDSESVCSSQDGHSAVSEEGAGEEGKAEDDVEFYMAGLIDDLADKK